MSNIQNAISEVRQSLECDGAKTKALFSISNPLTNPEGVINWNVPCDCYDNVLLPIPASLTKVLAQTLLKSGVKISQLAVKFFPTAARISSGAEIAKKIALTSENINAINRSIDIWKIKRKVPSAELKKANRLLTEANVNYEQTNLGWRLAKDLARQAQDQHNLYVRTLKDAVHPGWPAPGKLPFAIDPLTGRPLATTNAPPNWPGGQTTWESDKVNILRQLFIYKNEIENTKEAVDIAFSEMKKYEQAIRQTQTTVEKYSKEIKKIDESIRLNNRYLSEKISEKAKQEADLQKLDSATDFAMELDRLSGEYGLDKILTGMFLAVLEVIGYFNIVDKHQCSSEDLISQEGVHGAELNEETCKCDICPEGKILCEFTPSGLFDRGDFIQLPYERYGDELNYCMDPCDCGKSYYFSPGSLAIGGKPCFCDCQDKYQNPNDPDPIPYELKPCNKSECGFGSEGFGEFCTTKHPPDDPYGNMVARFPDWQGRYFWNQSRCEWVEKTCEDILFGGVQIGGEFIPGRTSMGNGTCKYNVTCYACDECPNGRTFELNKSEAEGKSCSELSNDELKLFSSCGECPNSSSSSSSSSSSPEIVDCWVCFEGEVESPDSGPQNLRRTKKECDSRPGGAGTQAREDLDCCKSSEGRWVKACADSEEKCANCPYGHDDNCQCVCPEVVFGGKTYQGTYDEQSNDCKYNVQCFQCDNTFSSFNDFEQADCEIVDAELTKKQIDQKPNCNDWSVVDRGREIKRWNSCAEADCKSSSSSSSCDSIVFAGVEYQGFSQNNECLYRVTCYSCDNGNCIPVDADITRSQALKWQNCEDWSSSRIELFNSCEDAICSSSSSSSCPAARNCEGTCCPEDYSCENGECLTEKYYCQS